MDELSRRDFLGLLGAAASLVGCRAPSPREVAVTPPPPAASSPLVPGQFELVQYPEKVPLRLLTDRPPQLETPLSYFSQDFTPNEAFYVRWHLSGIPTTVDLAKYRLKVTGHVEKELSFTLDDLRGKFEPFTIVAVNQCSGNSRSLAEPRVPGGQWVHGAVGCARWTGVRLKDVLAKTKLRPGAMEVSLHGMDTAPVASVPLFVKSLKLDHACDGEVMLAYEMNGAPLPMLNGFPLRVVVPGWYATYWVKALSELRVLDKEFDGYWMKTAYRIPTDPDVNESPDNLSKDMVPINRMKVHSFFVNVQSGDKIAVGKPIQLEGLATDGGQEIASVEVSTDGGKNWKDTNLAPSLGKYGWRRWTASWSPEKPGPAVLMVRATNRAGQGQKEIQWNRSGFARNVIERVEVVVV